MAVQLRAEFRGTECYVAWRAPLTASLNSLCSDEVRDVIDADTVLLDIDLGFEVIRRQSIRLARIDAPPRDTREGAAVVNTHRYVAHVFYAFNNQGVESTFLKDGT